MNDDFKAILNDKKMYFLGILGIIVLIAILIIYLISMKFSEIDILQVSLEECPTEIQTSIQKDRYAYGTYKYYDEKSSETYIMLTIGDAVGYSLQSIIDKSNKLNIIKPILVKHEDINIDNNIQIYKIGTNQVKGGRKIEYKIDDTMNNLFYQEGISGYDVGFVYDRYKYGSIWKAKYYSFLNNNFINSDISFDGYVSEKPGIYEIYYTTTDMGWRVNESKLIEEYEAMLTFEKIDGDYLCCSTPNGEEIKIYAKAYLENFDGKTGKNILVKLKYDENIKSLAYEKK